MKLYLYGCFFAIVGAIEVHQYQQLEEVEEHHKKPPIPIIKQSFEQHHDGYQFSYETGNGIHAQEQGFFKHKGDKKHETLVQQGTVTYHDEHGHPITLTYIADEHGFQPQGAHLPTPPPIPEEIQKALDQNAHQQEYEPEDEQEQQQQHIPAVYESLQQQQYQHQHQHPQHQPQQPQHQEEY